MTSDEGRECRAPGLPSEPGAPASRAVGRTTDGTVGPGNLLALRHGATSERQIGRRAAVQKRRLLRQLGLRQVDLDGLGRGLLANWARAAAMLAAMDDFAAVHGYLTASGIPRPFTKLYVAALNSEQRALVRLSEHLRDRADVPAPLAVLEGRGRRIREAR